MSLYIPPSPGTFAGLTDNPINNISLSGVLSKNQVGYYTLVDSQIGSDQSGTRNQPAFPFKTISSASAIAQGGDLVVINPGIYTDKNLQLPNLATYNFLPGSNLISTASAGTDSCFLVDLNHQFSIIGAGYFRMNGTNKSTSFTASSPPSIFKTVSGSNLNVSCGALDIYTNGFLGNNIYYGVIHYSDGDSILNLNCGNIGGNFSLTGYKFGTGSLCINGAPSIAYHNDKSSSSIINCFGSVMALADMNRANSFCNKFQLTTINPCTFDYIIACGTGQTFIKSPQIYCNGISCCRNASGIQQIYCDYLFATGSGYYSRILNSYADSSSIDDSNIFYNGSSGNSIFNLIATQGIKAVFNWLNNGAFSGIISSPRIDSTNYTGAMKLCENTTVMAGVWLTNKSGIYLSNPNSLQGQFLIDGAFSGPGSAIGPTVNSGIS